MRKLTLIALIAVALSGCIENGEDLTNQRKTVSICLDGVSYWVVGVDTNQAMMSPRVNPETLEFVRCN